MKNLPTLAIAALLCLAASTSSPAQSLPFKAPPGLCRVEPDRGGADERIWKINPFVTGNTTGDTLLLAAWIDCIALDKIRIGDRSSPPTQGFSVVELKRLPTHKPPIPEKLGEFIDALVARDKDRYTPLDRFRTETTKGGSTIVAHDRLAVYYGTRRVSPDGSLSGSVVSAYTMIGTRPIVVFNMTFRGRNYDDALLAETKAMVEGLHNAP